MEQFLKNEIRGIPKKLLEKFLKELDSGQILKDFLVEIQKNVQWEYLHGEFLKKILKEFLKEILDELLKHLLKKLLEELMGEFMKILLEAFLTELLEESSK